MKVKGFCLAWLMLTALQCGAEAKPPAPLWTHTLTWRDSKRTGNEPAETRIAGDTPEAILVERATGSLAALDARTGRELWQLTPGAASQAYADWHGDLLSWKLLGTARRRGMESVVLALPRIRYQHQNMDGGLEERTVHRLLCIGAHSGKTVWADSGDRFEIPGASIMVVNGILAFLQSPLEYWDAATGKRVDAGVARQDRASGQTVDQTAGTRLAQTQIRQILANNPGNSRITYRQDAANPPPWLFRVAAGQLQSIKAAHVGQYSYPLFTQQARVITYVDADNDSPGGSTFPKYLLASDLQGRRVWQFPARLQQHNYSLGESSPDSVQQAIAVWDTNICLALDSKFVYGLRVRDGAALWKRARFAQQIEQQGVWKRGCFGFASEHWTAAKMDGRTAKKAAVSYISAQSGKTQTVLTLPFILQVFATDNRLVVQTAPDTFRTYAMPSLSGNDQP